MPQWIVFLRKAVAESKYYVRDHALHRMGQRGITLEDVDRCIMGGEVVDKQFHGKDPKWVLRSRDGEGDVFYVVVALARPQPVVVTVWRDRDDDNDILWC